MQISTQISTQTPTQTPAPISTPIPSDSAKQFVRMPRIDTACTCSHTDARIRAVTADDTAQIALLMSRPEVLGNLLNLPFPSEPGWKERLDREVRGIGRFLVAFVDGTAVGLASLEESTVNTRRAHVLNLEICVAGEMQAKGLGNALMAEVVDYADNWAQALRVELHVFADNQTAITLYRRFGFTTDGLMKSWALHNGQYADALAMSRLHPDPSSLFVTNETLAA